MPVLRASKPTRACNSAPPEGTEAGRESLPHPHHLPMLSAVKLPEGRREKLSATQGDSLLSGKGRRDSPQQGY